MLRRLDRVIYGVGLAVRTAFYEQPEAILRKASLLNQSPRMVAFLNQYLRTLNLQLPTIYSPTGRLVSHWRAPVKWEELQPGPRLQPKKRPP